MSEFRISRWAINRRQFLKDTSYFLGSLFFPRLRIRSGEVLKPGVVSYGFALGNLPVRTDTTSKASIALFYPKDSLVRYEVAQGSWVRVIQDSDREINNGSLYIPIDYLKPLTAPEVTPIPLKPGEIREIDIDLTTLHMTALQNGRVVNDVPISAGKPGYETPTGKFSVISKFWAREMMGPGYNLPGVPFTQFITGNGVAIHGAWWHTRFGKQNVSHGCINARIQDAKWFDRFTLPAHNDFNQEILFANEYSTPVRIHY